MLIFLVGRSMGGCGGCGGGCFGEGDVATEFIFGCETASSASLSSASRVDSIDCLEEAAAAAAAAALLDLGVAALFFEFPDNGDGRGGIELDKRNPSVPS